MNDFLQNTEVFLSKVGVWGANLPQYILVPLIMVLAAVGTAAIVLLFQGLVRLIF